MTEFPSFGGNMAKKCVESIVADLTDRRGLRQEWEAIDPDIQQEILEKWEEIVRAHMEAYGG